MSEHPKGFPLEQVRKIAKNLISALVYCHDEVKVIHRDIKPENIMMDGGKAILVDFGVGALFAGEDDIIKGTAGSMRYFSPEIVKTGDKKVFGCKSDVWALGVTLYQLATNKYPFNATAIFVLQQQLLFEEPDYSCIEN